MLKILLVLGLAGWLVLVAWLMGAWAGCSTHTYFLGNGQMIVCTTCCFPGGNCTTTCY